MTVIAFISFSQSKKEPNVEDFNLGHFLIQIHFSNLDHTRNNIIKTFEKKNLKFFEKTVLDGNAARFLAKKNRVR